MAKTRYFDDAFHERLEVFIDTRLAHKDPAAQARGRTLHVVGPAIVNALNEELNRDDNVIQATQAVADTIIQLLYISAISVRPPRDADKIRCDLYLELINCCRFHCDEIKRILEEGPDSNG